MTTPVEVKTDSREAALQRELEESQTRCGQLESELLQFKHRLEERGGVQSNLHSEVDRLRSSKASLEESNAKLLQKLGAMEGEKVALEGRVDELVAQLEEVKREGEEKQSLLNSQLQRLEAQLREGEELKGGRFYRDVRLVCVHVCVCVCVRVCVVYTLYSTL